MVPSGFNIIKIKNKKNLSATHEQVFSETQIRQGGLVPVGVTAFSYSLSVKSIPTDFSESELLC